MSFKKRAQVVGAQIDRGGRKKQRIIAHIGHKLCQLVVHRLSIAQMMCLIEDREIEQILSRIIE
ncbi:hypothetical protein ACFSTD_00100 [Novosphingobium colocasiae]